MGYNLRHPASRGSVYKPQLELGIGCRHTSERIHQRYYILPANICFLVLYSIYDVDKKSNDLGWFFSQKKSTECQCFKVLLEGC